MGGTKGMWRSIVAIGLVAAAACGGTSDPGGGITDPPDDIPVDTAALNAAARTARTNTLLTQIQDAMNAVDQAISAGGGVPGAPPLNAARAGGFVSIVSANATQAGVARTESPNATQAGVAGTESPNAAHGAGMTGTLSRNAVLTGAAATTASAPPPPPDAAKCTYAEDTSRWNCPDFTQQNGVVVSTWFQFLDADDQPHRIIDTAKTVAIRRFVRKAGVVATSHTAQGKTVPAVDTMENVDTLVLSGIKGPPEGRRLNGHGTMKAVLVPEGSAVVRIQATTTTKDFAFTPPSAPGQPAAPWYPISGSVTAIVTGYREDMPQSGSTTTQVTTYDGSKIATLVITSQQGQVLRTCTWDMTAPTTAPTCS